MSNPEEGFERFAEEVVFAHELEKTARGIPAAKEAKDLERTAALAAAALAVPEAPPRTLRDRLRADGLAFCAAQRTQRGDSQPGFLTALPKRTPQPMAWGFLLGAAAASVALWFTVLRPQSVSLRDLRTQVLASDQTAVRCPWSHGTSPMRGDPQGDVVWSQERQDGWMTFRGLPTLPKGHRYQLWIADEHREAQLVDGGLFSIEDERTETIVAIHAKLRISKPKAFVVTVEDENGVVVSRKDHIVAIASL
jgi:hypothetical protein